MTNVRPQFAVTYTIVMDQATPPSVSVPSPRKPASGTWRKRSENC
jgi:hypothetical protein